MGPRVLPAALACAVLLFAGCLGASVAPTPVPSDSARAEVPAPLLDLRHCNEMGGHSVYNQQYPMGPAFLLPEPWKVADVTPDLGHPLTDYQGYPVTGPITGIYHPAIACQSATFQGNEISDFQMGFVAIRVEAPPWDTGGAKTHYLVDVLSIGDDAIAAAIDAAGLHASKGHSLVEAMGNLHHSVLDDEHHGIYETRVTMQDLGPMDPGPTRLWMLMKGADDKFRPFSLDFHNARGTHLAADQNGEFTHLRTTDHDIDMGFATIPMQGTAGLIWGLGYQDYDRTISVGPSFDVPLDVGWSH